MKKQIYALLFTLLIISPAYAVLCEEKWANLTLPSLDYAYEALEPVISKEIMQIHHSKHHQAYVTNYNAALEKLQAAGKTSDYQTVVSLQSALKFNGGGHINHSIFWKNLSPINQNGGKLPNPDSPLRLQIEKQWGSIDNFIKIFKSVAVAVQGSGWGWLGYNSVTKTLEIRETANQDPLSNLGLVPLLGIDVWEHAYYLQYQNGRATYLNEIWKVINWVDIEERYKAVTAPSV